MIRRPGPTTLIVLIFAILVLGRFVGSPVAAVVIVGPSMEPTLSVGDLVILRWADPEVGDIVLWCNTLMNCILHRVVEVGEDYIVTKGDANDINDPPVLREQVRYEALLSIPRYLWIPGLAMLVIGAHLYEKRKEGGD